MPRPDGGHLAGLARSRSRRRRARRQRSRARRAGPSAAADLSDPRVTAGLLFATAGRGGDDLTPLAAQHLPWLKNQSFAHMTKPALVVAGDHDDLPLSVRGPEWTTDPYYLSPGPKGLLTLFGAEHSLGGIVGYEAKETTDEHPARVALIQQVTWAYLRHALNIEHSSWSAAQEALSATPNPLAQLHTK